MVLLHGTGGYHKPNLVLEPDAFVILGLESSHNPKA